MEELSDEELLKERLAWAFNLMRFDELILQGQAKAVLPELLELKAVETDPRRLALLESSIGLAFTKLERYDEAEATFKKSIEAHGARGDHGAVADDLNNYASVLRSLGRLDESIEALKSSILGHEQELAKSGGDSKDASHWQRIASLGRAHYGIGNAYGDKGEKQLSLEHYANAIQYLRSAVEGFPDDHGPELALILTVWAGANEGPGSSEAFQEAIDILKRRRPEDQRSKILYGRACFDYGVFRTKQGDFEGSISLYEMSTGIFERIVREEPRHLPDLVDGYLNLGLCCLRLGQVGFSTYPLNQALNYLAVMERNGTDGLEEKKLAALNGLYEAFTTQSQNEKAKAVQDEIDEVTKRLKERSERKPRASVDTSASRLTGHEGDLEHSLLNEIAHARELLKENQTAALEIMSRSLPQLGQLYSMVGLYKEAEAAFDEFLEAAREEESLNFQRGMCLIAFADHLELSGNTSELPLRLLGAYGLLAKCADNDFPKMLFETPIALIRLANTQRSMKSFDIAAESLNLAEQYINHFRPQDISLANEARTHLLIERAVVSGIQGDFPPCFRDLQDAEALCLSLDPSVSPKKDILLAKVYRELAQAYIYGGPISSADGAFAQAKQALDDAQCDPLLVADAYRELAHVLKLVERNRDAIEVYKTAINLLTEEADLGKSPQAAKVAFIHGALAELYRAQGEFSLAVDHFVKAMTLTRQLNRQGWDKRHVLAFYASSAGAILVEHANLPELALKAQLEALELFRQLEQESPGSQTAYLGDNLHWMGMTYTRLGRLEDAEATIREALFIRRKMMQKGDYVSESQVAITLNNLAVVVGNLGRHDEAEALIDESVNIESRWHRI